MRKPVTGALRSFSVAYLYLSLTRSIIDVISALPFPPLRDGKGFAGWLKSLLFEKAIREKCQILIKKLRHEVNTFTTWLLAWLLSVNPRFVMTYDMRHTLYAVSSR